MKTAKQTKFVISWDGTYSYIRPAAGSEMNEEPNDEEFFRTFYEAKARLREYFQDRIEDARRALNQLNSTRKRDI